MTRIRFDGCDLSRSLRHPGQPSVRTLRATTEALYAAMTRACPEPSSRLARLQRLRPPPSVGAMTDRIDIAALIDDGGLHRGVSRSARRVLPRGSGAGEAAVLTTRRRQPRQSIRSRRHWMGAG